MGKSGTSRRNNAPAKGGNTGAFARVRTPSPAPQVTRAPKSPVKPTLDPSPLLHTLPAELLFHILALAFHPDCDSDAFTADASDVTPNNVEKSLRRWLESPMGVHRQAARDMLWETVSITSDGRVTKLRNSLLANIQHREAIEARIGSSRALFEHYRPVIRTLRVEFEYGTAHTALASGPPSVSSFKKLHNMLKGAVAGGLSSPGKAAIAVAAKGRFDARASIQTLVVVIRGPNAVAVPNDVLEQLSRFPNIRRLRIELPRQSLGQWKWPTVPEFVAKFPTLEALRIDRGAFKDDRLQYLSQVTVPATLKTLHLEGTMMPEPHLQAFLQTPTLALTSLTLIDVGLPEASLISLVTRFARTLESLTFVIGSQDEPMVDRKRLIEMREHGIRTHDGEWALKDRKVDAFGLSLLPPIGAIRPVNEVLAVCGPLNKLRHVTVGGPFALSPAIRYMLPTSLETLELVNCPDVRPTADAGTEALAEEVETLANTPVGIASSDIVAALAEDSYVAKFSRWTRLIVRGCGTNWARYREEGVVDELVYTATGEEVADPRPYDGALGRICERRGMHLTLAMARRGAA